jgi:hypothetical protein
VEDRKSFISELSAFDLVKSGYFVGDTSSDIHLHGRTLFDPSDNRLGPEFTLRRRVLRETLERLGSEAVRAQVLSAALTNVARWAHEKKLHQLQPVSSRMIVRVVCGDWGCVTADLTREFGSIFAALNMANALGFGGAYAGGHPAQEENMFRRTDCHFFDAGVNRSTGRYQETMTSLINGEEGRVLLDASHPRVCIRGFFFSLYAQDCSLFIRF